MRRWISRWRLTLALSLALVSWQGDDPAAALRRPRDLIACAQPIHELSVLTYNVAGLPDALSMSWPSRNCGLIGERLGGYSIACLQENFAWHAQLISRARLAYATTPDRVHNLAFGDGLCQLGVFEQRAVRRTPWASCSGVMLDYSDCLANKGILRVLHRIVVAPSRGEHDLEVLTVHMDAGDGPSDRAARRRQFAQLERFVDTTTADRAVIVAGDFNATPSDDADRAQLDAFCAACSMHDVGRELGFDDHQIDRVLFRSGRRLELVPQEWRVATEFVDDHGEPLSDHPGINVRFALREREAAAPSTSRRVRPAATSARELDVPADRGW
ncbi:MAG: endonuclease/exonuclease/phosphatase family protein [Planctomycetota bacterium]